MAEASFDVQVDASQAETFLGALVAKLQDTAPLEDAIADILRERLNFYFENEVDPSGQPWAPLAAVTVKLRTLKGLTPIKILTATGKGRENINVVPGGGLVKIVSGGEGTEYMDKHNQPDNPRLPQRRWLPTQEEVETGEIGEAIAAATESYLDPSLGQFLSGEIRRTPLLGRLLG